MAKVKKYAKGGSYYVEVPNPPKTPPKKKVEPVKGWNIPELRPDVK